MRLLNSLPSSEKLVVARNGDAVVVVPLGDDAGGAGKLGDPPRERAAENEHEDDRRGRDEQGHVAQAVLNARDELGLRVVVFVEVDGADGRSAAADGHGLARHESAAVVDRVADDLAGQGAGDLGKHRVTPDAGAVLGVVVEDFRAAVGDDDAREAPQIELVHDGGDGVARELLRCGECGGHDAGLILERGFFGGEDEVARRDGRIGVHKHREHRDEHKEGHGKFELDAVCKGFELWQPFHHAHLSRPRRTAEVPAGISETLIIYCIAF